MIVAVFDTNIILQGILSEGGPADECLRFVFAGKIRLVTTDVILGEIEDVISRPKLISKYPQLRTDRPKQLIAKIRSELLLLFSRQIFTNSSATRKTKYYQFGYRNQS